MLGLAQLLRPTPQRRRQLWVLGWLSVALLAALIAFEDVASRKEAIAYGLMEPLTFLKVLPPLSRWVAVLVPLLAVPLAAAGWVLWTAQRGQPARRLLTGLAAVFVTSAIVQDTEVHLLTPLVWKYFLEEGAEIIGAATLVVILIEMLCERPGAVLVAPTRRRGVGLAAVDVLLVTGAFLLVAHHIVEDSHRVRTLPSFYTGPVSLVEQPFRATHDNLRRIDVWVEIDGGASAEIFARLTPQGSDAPIRESRTEVYGVRFSNATATFHFAPIPDSGGTRYTLAVGVLSGPLPYVFLGLTDGELNPEGAAEISGAPTRDANDLAMRIIWHGSFVEGLLSQGPQRWWWVGEMSMNIYLWVLAVAVTWRGLSGPQPQFWRRFVWPAARTSFLITASIVTLTFLAMLAPLTTL